VRSGRSCASERVALEVAVAVAGQARLGGIDLVARLVVGGAPAQLVGPFAER